MKKIMRNEGYKFFKSKKNIIIIILFFVYLFGINAYNITQHDKYMQETAIVYATKQAQAEGDWGRIRRIIDTEDKTDQEIEILEQQLEFYKVEKDKLLVTAHYYRQDDPERYATILGAERDRYDNIFQGLSSGLITEDFLSERNLDKQQMQKQIMLNQYILDNEIQPILNPYTITGANSLVLFLGGNNLIILIFLIALLTVDMYLGEMEEGSYKLAYTQPFKRNQIFLGKLVTIATVSILLVAIAAILNFVTVSIIHEMGDMNYPTITSESIKSLSLGVNVGQSMVIPLWQYILMGIGLLLPILFFTVALIMCISIITDSSSNTLGFSIMLLVMAFILNNFVSDQSIVNLVYPYSYLFMDKVIGASNRSNYIFGILLNSVLAAGLFMLSYYKFVKKDFLGAKE